MAPNFPDHWYGTTLMWAPRTILPSGWTARPAGSSEFPVPLVVTLFVPGILAFAIVVVAYGNLAATVALQRADGVLKRIRATPLDPAIFLGGQLLSVLATTLLISAATVGAGAAAFGALPRAAAVPQLLVVLALGIACFAALGVAVSAAIPTADSAGAITNGTYLPLAMVSGMFSVDPARVNLSEADSFANHCVVAVSSLGSLIQTAVGSAGGSGGFRTKRSGCSA